METKGSIERVALTPVGAVEHYGREQQEKAEGNCRPGTSGGTEDTDHAQPAPGQYDIEGDGEELDKVKITYRQVGDCG